MKVKVKTKEGGAQEFSLKGSVDEIYLEDENEITKIEKIWNTGERKHEWTILIKEKTKVLKGQEPLFDNFNGLWVSSKGYFIHVISKDEAYILQEDGRKLGVCIVDTNGQTKLVGKLMERQIGPEHTRTKDGKTWPKPQQD
ncbi:MAG TPA: hypothetical protein VNX68_19800 [Nitrosopumilaceae archaeon]|jgi:hypothetical protein|nr:hypothetical protein [Nitrosopumilaceae archaeon]